MNSESIFQRHKKGALVTAIGLALSLTACGVVTPPALDKLPGVTATPSAITVAEGDSTTFDVVLDTEPKANVTIIVESLDVTEAATDVTELTFTKNTWDIAQTVTVTGVNDGEADGNQNINIELAIKQVANVQDNVDADYSELAPTNVAATVTDISAAGFTVSASTLATSESVPVEGVSAAGYTVVLNTQPAADVVIDIVSEDTSEGTVDKATLTFNALNWQTPQTVTVSSVDDDIADGNQTYNVSMTVNAANTADTTGYAALTLPPVAVTNADDDVAGFTVSAAALDTSESGGAPATYTVRLNTEPSGNVVINVASGNIDEGTVAPATLTFNDADWSSPQMVTVSPVDDFMMDGNQTYEVTMTDGGTLDTTGYADLTLSPVVVTNADDDTAGFTVSDSTLNTTENGSTTSYTVVLNTQPSANVVINIASGDTTEGKVSPTTLTFNDLDWRTERTVTVTPEDDTDPDGSQIYNVNMAVDTAATADADYLGLSLSAITVTNADDEASGPSSAANPIQVAFTDLPYAGTSEDPSSYFEVSGLEAGVTYNVTLTQLTGGVDLRVFAEGFANLQTCSSIAWDADDESCLVAAASTSLWIKVDQDPTFSPGGTFTLNLVAQP